MSLATTLFLLVRGSSLQNKGVFLGTPCRNPTKDLEYVVTSVEEIVSMHEVFLRGDGDCVVFTYSHLHPHFLSVLYGFIIYTFSSGGVIEGSIVTLIGRCL